MLKLTHEMTFHLTVSGPLGSTKGAPGGERICWEMTSGTLEGPRIHGKIARPGSDWMNVSPDGFWRPDVHISFITNDGALVLLHYTGLVQQSEAFIRAAEDGRATDWDAQYMRMAMWFETGAAQYAWLNQSLFLAQGRLAGNKRIEYRIYRVE
jgi:Protein of unknown function (DUF3237)